MSVEEQGRIHESRVAIAGAGGDGGMLAIMLARMGVGELRLADPDNFEVENINRQAVCNSGTIGLNKALAVGDYIQKINPDIKTVIYNNGVSTGNVEEFLSGVDLVIDETEFTLHALAVMIARQARKEKIPNLTAFNIGFGAVATTFHPDGVKLESRLGFTEEQSLEEISDRKVDVSRWLPYLPSYGDIRVLGKVAKGEKPAPSIAPGVAIAASIGATQAFLNLVKSIDNNRPEPIYAPKAIVMDSMSLKANVIKFSRSSHYRNLTRVLALNLTKRNPNAAY
jgi:molybdopterin/thiamine biosynthesis adenylyltransferase